MSFSAFYQDKRSECKKQRKKKEKLLCNYDVDDNTISINNKEKVSLLLLDKKTNEEFAIFVPKYFFFDITYFSKENYLVISDKKNNKIEIYVTPLIRTLLLDIKTYITKNDNLARTIKERIDVTALRIIRKSIEKSVIVVIDNKQYIRVNADFKKVQCEDNNNIASQFRTANMYAVVNNQKHKNTNLI